MASLVIVVFSVDAMQLNVVIGTIDVLLIDATDLYYILSVLTTFHL